MARRRKKREKGKQKDWGNREFLNDISISEYADSSKKLQNTRRIKKSSSSTIPRIENMTSASCKTSSDDLNWFDRDLDEMDFDTPLQTSQSISSGENDTENNMQEPGNGGVKKKKKLVRTADQPGVEYPIIFWDILSEYIAPEVTGTFAAICKSANKVIHTFGFWKRIYLRYYSPDASLPDDLQPENLERLHGLRWRVIRALFYIYHPLAIRTKPSIPFENEPHYLEGKRCIFSWYKMLKAGSWNFCFKFASEKAFYDDHQNEEVDLLNGYKDLFFNPEDMCCVLQVSCQNFQFVQTVMGLLLRKVYLSVSRDMRHHQLKLVFKNNLLNTSLNETIVVLDPVVNLRVFDWWDPSYPFFCSEKIKETSD